MQCSVHSTKYVRKSQTNMQSWLVTLPRAASSKLVLVSPEEPWALEVAGTEASSDSGLVTSIEVEAAVSVVSSVSSPQPTWSCSFSALPSSLSSPLSPSMAFSPQRPSTPSRTSVGMEWDKGTEIRAERETKGESETLTRLREKGKPKERMSKNAQN